MPASYEHPTLGTRVTTEQRDRAADYLKAAYADGRITEAEFDRRIGLVLGATTRKDLNEAFYGLVDVPPVAGPTYGSPDAYGSNGYGSNGYGSNGYGANSYGPYGSSLSPTSSRYPVQQEGSPGGALAHFSGIFTSVVGPGIGYAVSSPGSLARKESAKAFNFQLVSLIALVIGGTLQAITDSGLVGFLVGLGWVVWVILSIVGGVKAARGENWKNPVTKAVKLQVLPEK